MRKACRRMVLVYDAPREFMTSAANIDEVLRRRLAAFHPVVVYLFGSAVQGRARPDSDLDVAFLAAHPPDPCSVFDTAQQVAVEIGREVDLVDLHRASAVLKAQVVGTGRRLWVGDAVGAAEFEMYALSEYARANEERREPLRVFEESLHAR